MDVQGLVQDNAERPVGVVLPNQDHCVAEVRIVQATARDQQTAPQTFQFVASFRRSTADCLHGNVDGAGGQRYDRNPPGQGPGVALEASVSPILSGPGDRPSGFPVRMRNGRSLTDGVPPRVDRPAWRAMLEKTWPPNRRRP